MAFYRITITLKDNSIKGIRELDQEDIDIAWLVFKSHAVSVYTEKKILDFEVVRISTYSDDFLKWKLAQKKLNPPPPKKVSFNRKDGKNANKITLGEKSKNKNQE